MAGVRVGCERPPVEELLRVRFAVYVSVKCRSVRNGLLVISGEYAVEFEYELRDR